MYVPGRDSSPRRQAADGRAAARTRTVLLFDVPYGAAVLLHQDAGGRWVGSQGLPGRGNPGEGVGEGAGADLDGVGRAAGVPHRRHRRGCGSVLGAGVSAVSSGSDGGGVSCLRCRSRCRSRRGRQGQPAGPGKACHQQQRGAQAAGRTSDKAHKRRGIRKRDIQVPPQPARS